MVTAVTRSLNQLLVGKQLTYRKTLHGHSCTRYAAQSIGIALENEINVIRALRRLLKETRHARAMAGAAVGMKKSGNVVMVLAMAGRRLRELA